MYRPTASPRWFSGQWNRIQRMPAGVVMDSPTPSNTRSPSNCRFEPARAVAAEVRLQNTNPMANGNLTP